MTMQTELHTIPAAPTIGAPRVNGRDKAIDRGVARFVARHPQHAGIMERAAAIVRADAIHMTTTTATVDGSSGKVYTLTPQRRGRWACNCPAFYYNPVKIGDVHHCKHTLAVALLFHVEGGF